MVMLFSLLMLAPFFMPVQDNVTATDSPVEVLKVEVLAQELRTPNVNDPRGAPPQGTVSINDVRGRPKDWDTMNEQPTIKSRSRELNDVARRTDQQRVPRSSYTHVYEYRVELKNNSPKKIKSIAWEYQLSDSSGATTLAQRAFLCPVSVKAGAVKTLKTRTPSPPDRVVDASGDKSQMQKVIINRVEYTDGSTWTREGWQHADLTIRDGQCRIL